MTESREKTAFKKQVLKVSIYCNNETLNLHEQKTEQKWLQVCEHYLYQPLQKNPKPKTRCCQKKAETNTQQYFQRNCFQLLWTVAIHFHDCFSEVRSRAHAKEHDLFHQSKGSIWFGKHQECLRRHILGLFAGYYQEKSRLFGLDYRRRK